MKKELSLLLIICLFQCSHFEKKTEPEIISHRGGKLNWPENTMCAFKQNVAQGVKTIEFDVQVSHDGQVVVYHAGDLSNWTNATGPVFSQSAEYVTQLDATVKYTGPDSFQTVCSDKDKKIPLLVDVLQELPKTQFVVDMKSPETKELVDALVTTIPTKDWFRLRFYSTNPEHTKLLRQSKPEAIIFEDRNETFERIMTTNNSGKCIGDGAEKWVGYELVRTLQVCDQTKLGSTCLPKVPFTMWNSESVTCTRSMTGGANIVFFGINTAEAYHQAAELGADAVFSDNPSLLLAEKKK